MPIIYDKSTERKAMSDKRWMPVPKSIKTYYDLMDWVKDNHVTLFGYACYHSGVSKICYKNDKKTVFKYNYDVKEHGNQIAREIKVYNKWKSRFSLMLPEIYAYGKHWMIEDNISESFTDRSFLLYTGIRHDTWNTIKYHLSIIQSNLKKYVKDNSTLTYSKLKKILIKACKKNKNIKISKIEQLFDSPKLLELVLFCFVTKVEIIDMHFNNIRKSKCRKHIAIIDFGI